jgi:hypothetical protein
MAGFDWKSAISTIAPILGAALPLPPPIGSMATKFVAEKLLGKPDATEDQIAAVVQNGDHDVIAKLQQADADFKLKTQQMNIDLAKAQLDYGKSVLADVQSARAMQIQTKDWIPKFLAIGVSVMFVGMLVALLFIKLGDKDQPLLILLGSLGTAWTAIIGFYFGSSSGSQRKTEILNQQQQS